MSCGYVCMTVVYEIENPNVSIISQVSHGATLTVGRYWNTASDPTVPSPIAIFARLTGGSDMPKYALVMYG